MCTRALPQGFIRRGRERYKSRERLGKGGTWTAARGCSFANQRACGRHTLFTPSVAPRYVPTRSAHAMHCPFRTTTNHYFQNRRKITLTNLQTVHLSIRARAFIKIHLLTEILRVISYHIFAVVMIGQMTALERRFLHFESIC